MKAVVLSFIVAWCAPFSTFRRVVAQTPIPTPPVPSQVVDFLLDRIEFDIVAAFVAACGVVWAVVRWVVPWVKHRLFPPRISDGRFAFDVITDPSEVLPTLLPGEGPLADHAIPYQERVTGRHIEQEICAAMVPRRYVLVKGKRGAGKTREAGVVGEALCREGATVLALRRDAWLEVPNVYPAGVPDRNLVFVLDRLEFQCTKQERPSTEDGAQAGGWRTFQDRLRETLDWFETACGDREVRVIATARDEPDEWDRLDYSEDDRLWSRFELYPLPAPECEAVVAVLAEATGRLNIQTDWLELRRMAASNDGTMRNVVENLRLAGERGSLKGDEYRPTLQGSYGDSYLHALARRAAVKHIYDALDVLMQLKATPFVFLVRDVAAHLWGGNIVTRRLRRVKLGRALDYLTESRVIPHRRGVFTPADGQIEERGRRLDAGAVLESVVRIVLDASAQRGQVVVGSLDRVGYELATRWERSHLASRVYRQIIELQPEYAAAYYNLGYLLDDMERYEEAEGAYRRAIELQPEDATAYNNLGALLAKVERYEEAEGAYRRAIELQPEDATAYNNLGALLAKVERYEEAEGAYRRAIELQPEYATAYRNRAYSLITQGRYDEALADIEMAGSLEPDHPYLHARWGHLHYARGDFKESERCYRRSVALDPKSPGLRFDLGLVLLCRGRQAEARVEYERGLALTCTARDLREAARELQDALSATPGLPGGRELLQLLMDALASR